MLESGLANGLAIDGLVAHLPQIRGGTLLGNAGSDFHRFSVVAGSGMVSKAS
jgi:hypothetical protein